MQENNKIVISDKPINNENFKINIMKKGEITLKENDFLKIWTIL